MFYFFYSALQLLLVPERVDKDLLLQLNLQLCKDFDLNGQYEPQEEPAMKPSTNRGCGIKALGHLPAVKFEVSWCVCVCSL